MRASRALFGLCIAAALLSGCSGSGPGGAGAGATASATKGGGPVDGGQTATGQTAAEELPKFMADFDRVCETQVGFGGAAAYDSGPGPHPVILFADYSEPPSLIKSGATLPAGWTVAEDLNFDDNSELADVHLVGCSRRVSATPNGTKCDFKGNAAGAAPITLELTDTVSKLTSYAAASGKQVGEPQTLAASSTRCPSFVSIREGDTQHLNDPTDDQYVNALKGVVNP